LPGWIEQPVFNLPGWIEQTVRNLTGLIEQLVCNLQVGFSNPFGTPVRSADPFGMDTFSTPGKPAQVKSSWRTTKQKTLLQREHSLF